MVATLTLEVRPTPPFRLILPPKSCLENGDGSVILGFSAASLGGSGSKARPISYEEEISEKYSQHVPTVSRG